MQETLSTADRAQPLLERIYRGEHLSRAQRRELELLLQVRMVEELQHLCDWLRPPGFADGR